MTIDTTSLLGMWEMEHAALRLMKACLAADTWAVVFAYADFGGDELLGVNELRLNGWLERRDGGRFVVGPAFVERVTPRLPHPIPRPADAAR